PPPTRARNYGTPGHTSRAAVVRDLIMDLPAAGGLAGGTTYRARGHVAALPQVVCAQRGPVTDQPQVAERVDEAALPVNAPWRLVVADLVDTAVRSSCHGAFDKAVGVVHENLDSDRRCANSGRGVPAVVRRFAQEVWGPVDGQ